MPINASPHFERAQTEYEQAQTTEQKIRCLKKMIALAPKHKSSENLLANLRTRKKKLENQLNKQKRSGKSSRIGIKKEDMQAVIVGKTNSGKSSLLKILTNAEPKISEQKFTTTSPIIGMMPYATTSIQLIEIPAMNSEYYDKGLVYTADVILILINSLEDLNEIEKQIKTSGKKIIVFNKKNSDKNERKISSTLQSKKYNFILIDTLAGVGERLRGRENFEQSITRAGSRVGGQLQELKEKIFQSFDKLRIYTKEPGKEPDKKRPMILEPNSTVSDVAEKILKGFSKKIKQIKIWGPSSKFPGQIVGLKHKVKDLDIVEFKTK